MPRLRKSETICFRVDPAVRLRLEAIAHDDDAHDADTLSEYVRTIIDEWVESYATSHPGGMDDLIDALIAHRRSVAEDAQAHELEMAAYAKQPPAGRSR